MGTKLGKKLLFIGIVLLTITQSKGQDTLSGIIVNESNVPLPYAMVISMDTLLNRTLAYTNSNDDGSFSLIVSDTTPIVLITRYLGKTPDTLTLTPPWTEPVVIRLSGGTALPEIEITSDRPPITARGDTTTYNLADFRDSTDNNIEDILRKLPGVEVNENGSIEVNGKAIQTILVEGTDLFGMDYQLASKNIRASDIGNVETIDHYQEDAVMRTVNFSDEVVINLKLHPDKRSLLAGELLGAGGWGTNGERYQIYAPLYRISRRNKTFAIVNLDNVASDNGLGQKARMLINGEDVLRAPLFGSIDYYTTPAILTQGLPSPFTDNTRTLGGQLRHEYSQGNHTVFVRLDGLRESSEQLTRQRETFVGTNSSYLLNNQQSWAKQHAAFNSAVEYRYLGSDQRTSLRAYGKLGRDVTDVNRLFSGDLMLEDTSVIRYTPFLSRFTATRKLSERTVIRAEVAHQSERRRAKSIFTQSDLSFLFNEAGEVDLRQSLYARQSQSLLTTRWLTRFSSRLKVDVSTTIKRERLALTNSLNTDNYADTLLLEDLMPAFKLVYTKGNWLYRFQGEYHVNRQGLNRYHARWSVRAKLPKDREFVFNASQKAILMDYVSVLSDIIYTSGPFNAIRLLGVNELSERTSLGVSMRWANSIKLSRTTLSTSLNRSSNDLIKDYTFVGNAVVQQPLLAPSQYSFGLRGTRSFFSLLLKSDVRLNGSIRYRAGVYQTNGTLSNFTRLSYATSARASLRMSKALRLKGALYLNYVDGLTGLNLGLFTGRVNTEVIVNISRLRLYLAGFTVINRSNGDRSMLWNTYLGGRYQLPLKDGKSFSVFLKIFNPLNRPTLERRYSNGLFERENIVTTTGVFGFAGCSFGL